MRTEVRSRLGGRRLSLTWSEQPEARYYCACIAASALAAVACFLTMQSWRIHTKAQSIALEAAETVTASLATGVSEGGTRSLSEDVDPALRLDAQHELQEPVDRLERSARAFNIDVRRIEVVQVNPTAQALGRIRVVLVAEGQYTDLKQWMAAWSAEMPAATLSQFRLQRAASWQEARPMLEWSGSVTVWSRPLEGGR